MPARTVIWAAGVRASGLAARLAEQAGAEVDRAGRVTVGPDLTLPGHPEVIALGDMASVSDGQGGVRDLPGLAPEAIQQGAYAARLIKRRLRGEPAPRFATSTRATWPRSGAAVRSPTSAGSVSVDSQPG